MGGKGGGDEGLQQPAPMPPVQQQDELAAQQRAAADAAAKQPFAQPLAPMPTAKKRQQSLGDVAVQSMMPGQLQPAQPDDNRAVKQTPATGGKSVVTPDYSGPV
jgi:ATP adenylyltransferase/5',5'''-P-1,P-4-tetraphosphate phosphorylase II